MWHHWKQLLWKLADLTPSARDSPEHLDGLLSTLQQAVNADAASYWRLDADACLQLACSTDIPQQKWERLSKQAKLREGSGVSGYALREREPVLFPSEDPRLEHDPTIDRELNQETKAMISAPVLLPGQPPFGVLNVLRIRKGTRFNHDDVELVGLTARLLAYTFKKIDRLPDFQPSTTPFTPVGDSMAMQELKRKMEMYKNYSVPLLILGETGTGKEVCARYLHSVSNKRDEPFLAVNCGEMEDPQALISRLFGHARGAYTGAVAERKGVFEEAGEGTVFLDEIGNAPLQLQRMLLRVLQEKTGTPLGGDEEKKYKCRTVFATNKDLRALIRERMFMEDLYYRVSTHIVKLPPLRDRPEDIPALSEHLLKRAIKAKQCPKCELTKGAVDWLCAQYWRGNVRELDNVLQQAAFESSLGKITESVLSDYYESNKLESDSSLASSGKAHIIVSGDDAKQRVETALEDSANYNTKNKLVISRLARATKLDERTVKKYLREIGSKS